MNRLFEVATVQNTVHTQTVHRYGKHEADPEANTVTIVTKQLCGSERSAVFSVLYDHDVEGNYGCGASGRIHHICHRHGSLCLRFF